VILWAKWERSQIKAVEGNRKPTQWIEFNPVPRVSRGVVNSSPDSRRQITVTDTPPSQGIPLVDLVHVGDVDSRSIAISLIYGRIIPASGETAAAVKIVRADVIRRYQQISTCGQASE